MCYIYHTCQTPQPEVRVLDVESEEISEADVLVMATDGLWDVMPNERVAEVVHHGLSTSRLGLQRTPSQAASDRKVVNFSDDEMDPEVSKRQHSSGIQSFVFLTHSSVPIRKKELKLSSVVFLL